MIVDISLHEAINQSIYILLQTFLSIQREIYLGGH